MFFPILTSSSLQPLKADSIILLTLSGILNFFKELQPLNIPDVILLMSASQTTFSSFSQPPNKPLSILETLPGILTFFTLLHAKASKPMFLTPFFIVMSFRYLL